MAYTSLYKCVTIIYSYVYLIKINNQSNFVHCKNYLMNFWLKKNDLIPLACNCYQPVF